MRTWNLLEVDAPDGTRDPVVLHSADDARAVLIRIDPGQQLREHQVKERAWICVVDGSVHFEAGGETVEAGPGMLLMFDPDERHSVAAPTGGRILMVLAPWPGEGHYRGGDAPAR
jgi:quercetin dioxygenase-like cupin family protein